MKLIKFVRDYDLAHVVGFRRPIHQRGEIKVMSDDKARHFIKKVFDWKYFEKTGKFRKIPLYAVVLKDLGRHFGRSKNIYLMNGKSRVPFYDKRYGG